MKKRQSNNPKRRIAPAQMFDDNARRVLANRLVYVGSGLHKRFPGDYNFQPPVSPRPSKSICDGRRMVLLGEARQLFRNGIMRGMVSGYFVGEDPKYVWSVDDNGDAYEAKIGANGYHGYRLEEEDSMRDNVLREWKVR